VYGDRVVHTVGRLEDLQALAARDDRPRVVLERMTSMRRHGFSARELREAAGLLSPRTHGGTGRGRERITGRHHRTRWRQRRLDGRLFRDHPIDDRLGAGQILHLRHLRAVLFTQRVPRRRGGPGYC
jgi:hypothetical protein